MDRPKKSRTIQEDLSAVANLHHRRCLNKTNAQLLDQSASHTYTYHFHLEDSAMVHYPALSFLMKPP